MSTAVRKAAITSMRTQLDLWSQELGRHKSQEVKTIGGLLRVAAGHLGHALESWPDDFGQVIDADSRAFDLTKAKGGPAIQ